MSKIKIPFLWGVYCGLMLGHLDLFYRLLSQNFEWFEIYQSLLLPTLIVPFFFLLLTPFVWLKGLWQAEKDTNQNFFFSYQLLSTLLPLFVILQLVIQGFFQQDQSIYQSPRLEVTLLLSALFFVLCTWFAKSYKPQIASFYENFSHSLLGRLLRHYRSFLSFSLLACLATDIYLQESLSSLTVRSSVSDDQPNIVVVTLDTVRADHLGTYGYTRPTTPMLDSISEKSVVFSNAYSTASWTLPAHASLFTGKYVSAHGAHMSHQKLDSQVTTLAEVLRNSGFATAGFVAGPYCKKKYGIGQGFATYSDRLDFFEYRHTKDKLSIRRFIDYLSPAFHDWLFRGDGEKTAPELNSEVSRWLEKNKNSRFFLFLNYFDAHDPYNLGERYQQLFTQANYPYDQVHWFLDSLLKFRSNYEPARDVNKDLLDYTISLYDAEIRHLDFYLGELLNTFRRLGLYDNTLFVFLSDHGEEFLDHDSIFHEHTLYNELIHIPLMFHWPQKFSSKHVDSLVSIVDVFPTLLELTGEKRKQDIDGLSLLPLLEGNNSHVRDFHIAERFRRDEYGESGLVALVEKNWKLIRSAPEREIIPNSLFHLAEDPEETQNLLRAAPPALSQLRADLEASFQGTPLALEPSMTPNSD